jgi:predicted AlkP superfamily phosphohydrolase/phosphomutase
MAAALSARRGHLHSQNITVPGGYPMAFWNRRKEKTAPRRRVVVLGIDGVPYTLLQRLREEGRMPNLTGLIAGGVFKRMNSVYPTVSSVAWSSFMTGKNPAKHGIFGFVDRDPATLKTTIPTSRAMQSRTLWEILSDAGKRVVVMNVPVTYPPRQVNGILIAGFLSPSLDKVAYPPEMSQKLKEWGYRIDTDPWLARESKEKLLADVNDTFDRRVRTLFNLMEGEEWDYFHCHIMSTDRLFHFLWEQLEQNDPIYAPQFLAFMEKLDRLIGDVMSRLDDNTTLIVMSDHGFCTLDKEIYVNYWLQQQGWLQFDSPEPKSIEDMSASSIAYSLDPGRVFINLKGREKAGSVELTDYESWRERIAAAALELTDPDSGRRIFQRVARREEIYHGPLLDRAADLFLIPHNGFDPKGPVNKLTLTFKGPALVGMHTYDDASLIVAGQSIQRDDLWVADVMPTILELMDVERPAGLDGQSLLDA